MATTASSGGRWRLKAVASSDTVRPAVSGWRVVAGTSASPNPKTPATGIDVAGPTRVDRPAGSGGLDGLAARPPGTTRMAARPGRKERHRGDQVEAEPDRPSGPATRVELAAAMVTWQPTSAR